MKSAFVLNSRLAADTLPVTNLALSDVRLMNDCRWPWFILVPRINGAEELHYIDHDDQIELFHEISAIALALDAITGCHKINIGVIGNIVRQLHVHIVARYENDPNWPNPIWGFGEAIAYDDDRAAALIKSMRRRFA